MALRILYALALSASCAFAFRFGGRSERHGAVIILVGSLLTTLVEGLPAFDWRYSRQGLVVVDLGVLIAYFVLAQRSSRFWPLWTTAFQLIAVMTHLVILVEPRRVLQAYALAQGFWAYPMLASIVIGSAGSRRRAQRRSTTSPSLKKPSPD